MNFGKIMEFLFRLAAELLLIFRISKEDKREESKIKQKEVFVENARKQQEVSIKDSDEKLIADVVSSSGEEREKKLEEIRKIISK